MASLPPKRACTIVRLYPARRPISAAVVPPSPSRRSARPRLPSAGAERSRPVQVASIRVREMAPLHIKHTTTMFREVTSATAAVPSGIDAVDPTWLTEALRADSTIPDDAVVSEVVAERIAEDSGFSSLLYRLNLTGSPGLPATIIVKLAAQSEARGAMELLGGYRREPRSTATSPAARRSTLRTSTPRASPTTALISCSCWRTCRTGTTPTTSRGCRSNGPGCASRNWPAFTRGQCNRRILQCCSCFPVSTCRRSVTC